MDDLVQQLRRDYCDRAIRLQAANRIEEIEAKLELDEERIKELEKGLAERIALTEHKALGQLREE